jgi:hypothetical protein
MRSMRMMGRAAGIVVVLGALVAASSASATPTFEPAGTAFSGASDGEHVFSMSANVKWRCNQVRWAGTTASPASDTVSLAATYGTATGVSGSWCRWYVGGAFTAATFVPSANWSLKTISYNPLDGSSTGTLTTSGGTAITMGTCTITLASGSVMSTQGQNDTWSPAGPGATITISASGMSYTSSGCSAWGIGSGSNMTYSGQVYVPEIYATS